MGCVAEKAARQSAIVDYDASNRRTEGQVITIVDLKAELGKLTMLKGRRPEMTEADRKGTNAFATLMPFRDGNIFSAKFSGNGACERHPNGDELVQLAEAQPKFPPMPTPAKQP